MVVRSFDNRGRWVRQVGGHLVVSLVAISVFCANWASSGMWYQGDSSRHAMNGVLYMDMIRDGGFTHPRSYAERYYVQYPAIDPVDYPPVFYVLEAFLFQMFGISPFVARLTVLLFALLGSNMFLIMCRIWFPEWLSILGGILFLLQPGILVYQQWVMLEVPSLSMSILAIYVLYVSVEKGHPWMLFSLPICVALAVLTKQNTLFLVVLSVLWIVYRRKWTMIKSRHFMAGVLTGIILLAPYIAVYSSVGGTGYLQVIQGQGLDRQTLFSRAVFYVKSLPSVVSYPIVLLWASSIISFRWLKDKNGFALVLFWCVSSLLVPLSYALVESRALLYIAPPIVLSCLFLISFLATRFKVYLLKGKVGWVMLGLLVSLHVSPNNIWGQPDIQGFDKAVDFILEDLSCHAVLYDGQFNGNFIFLMRARDKERRVFIFRGSKIIYSAIFWKAEYSDYITTESEFYEALKRYGIKFVIVEEKDILRTPGSKRLRQWTKGNRFRPVHDFKMRPNVYAFNSLIVHEYLDFSPITAKEIQIEMPRISNRITLQLGNREGQGEGTDDKR